MSKVQEKESTLLNNLSGTEIANELDSRLRDLEKNIAVAREFIKLADESYSELRHKWNLLHAEVRNESQTHITGRATVPEEKAAVRPRNKQRSKTKAEKVTTLDEPSSPPSTDMAAKPQSHAKPLKNMNRAKKEPEISNEDMDSLGSKKSPQPYRDPGRRRGKSSGHN
jgi:predicted nuclease with TOPRIM domain